VPISEHAKAGLATVKARGQRLGSAAERAEALRRGFAELPALSENKATRRDERPRGADIDRPPLVGADRHSAREACPGLRAVHNGVKNSCPRDKNRINILSAVYIGQRPKNHRDLPNGRNVHASLHHRSRNRCYCSVRRGRARLGTAARARRPVKAGGQCWKSHGGAENNFGHFESCPQAASTPTTRRAARPRT
jgi:hypothetical protein